MSLKRLYYVTIYELMRQGCQIMHGQFLHACALLYTKITLTLSVEQLLYWKGKFCNVQ